MKKTAKRPLKGLPRFFCFIIHFYENKYLFLINIYITTQVCYATRFGFISIIKSVQKDFVGNFLKYFIWTIFIITKSNYTQVNILTFQINTVT